MANTGLKSEPAQARKRIESLESKVGALTGALNMIVSAMQRAGITISARQTGLPVQTPRPGRDKRGNPGRATPAGARNKPANTRAPVDAGGVVAAVARGEAAKLAWVHSGEVVPAKTLADRWGLTPQALGPAARRGEVFAVVVKRQRYYPKEFLDLDRNAVSVVTQSLGGLPPEAKLIFWKRPHGALGGKTVHEALTASKGAGQLARVAQLAQAWADEARARSHVAEAA